MIEEQQYKRHYKIEPGDIFYVKRRDINGYTFYKIAICKKKQDDTKEYFDKNIAFKKGTDIADGTKIRILDFFEDVRENKNDKYNPIWSIFITDFEIIEESNEDALSEFNQKIEESGITDDMLAF